MAAITLISEAQAKEGNRFYYLGPQSECGECKFKGACFNLETGSMYEITSVREQKHVCPFNEDKVRVVEIKKVPQTSVILKKSAIEGSLITFQKTKCRRLDCKNYRICNPYGLEEGKKYSVVEVGSNVKCLMDLDLMFVKLS